MFVLERLSQEDFYFNIIIVEGIKKNDNFEMANQELAEVYFKKLKLILPDIIMIVVGNKQYFINTKDGIWKLRHKLTREELQLKDDLYYVRMGISQIDALSLKD